MNRRGLLFAPALWAALIAVAGCGVRGLSENEVAFLATTHGAALDTSGIDLSNGALIGNIPISRPPRPQIACREKIWPPETGEAVTGKVAGVVLYERIMIARWFFTDDFLEGYPQTLPLGRAMFLAHEATHVWQWQQRRNTGYAPWKAAMEHGASADPYLFEVGTEADFLDYGYEQQASLVEEYVCCRALDPAGARTARLKALLEPVFPGLPDRDPAGAVLLPWAGAVRHGICA